MRACDGAHVVKNAVRLVALNSMMRLISSRLSTLLRLTARGFDVSHWVADLLAAIHQHMCFRCPELFQVDRSILVR